MHFHREIEKLKKSLLAMGAIVEEAIHKALDSVHERDSQKAQAVIDGDVFVDIKELEIDEECLKILALYQPVAEDLRFISVVMKINNDLERVGDLAGDIAERALTLANHPPVPIPPQLAPMARAATNMLRESLDAFVNENTEQATSIRDKDDEVDTFNREMLSHVCDQIMQHPESVRTLLQLFSISQYLERVADRATAIGEDVVYMVLGDDIRHRRKIQKAQQTAKLQQSSQA